jgi:hypothetical protein
MLRAILASQDRKVLLVESIERLLEKSTRDAFTDLLTLVARDKSWRLVLTCRDYSADRVRACFLEARALVILLLRFLPWTTRSWRMSKLLTRRCPPARECGTAHGSAESLHSR